MRKKVLFLVLLLGTVITVAQFPFLGEFEFHAHGPLKRFSSYEELKNFVNASVGAPLHREHALYNLGQKDKDE